MLNVREPECAAPCMRAPGLAHSRFSLTGTLRDSLLSACADRYCLDARCGLALRVSRSGGLEQYLYSFQCHSSGRRAPAGLWPGAAAHARLCPDSECPSLCVASLLRCYSHKQHQWVPRRGGFNAPGLIRPTNVKEISGPINNAATPNRTAQKTPFITPPSPAKGDEGCLSGRATESGACMPYAACQWAAALTVTDLKIRIMLWKHTCSISSDIVRAKY